MELSGNIAREIVEELSKVTPLNINIMDSAGCIIASTDKERIGNHHEGANRVIVQKLDEFVITDADHLSGARPGLNYPIIMQEKIIGVLGITGKYADIVDSARIIKRMTELYLQNAYNTEQKQFGKNIRNRYFDEWINSDPKEISAEFIDRGRALGFDITIPRRFMDCSVYSLSPDSGMKHMQRIERAEEGIAQYVCNLNPNNIYFKSGASLVFAVSETADGELLQIAKTMVSIVETRYSLKLAIGIDSYADSFLNAKKNYLYARIANRSCMRTHKWDIRFYNDLRMELLVDDLPDSTKLEFIHSLFGSFGSKEIIDSIHLLENYYDSDGSLLLTAEKLYIHKNTLQYRLKKIAEQTGYDPRSIRHSSLFCIAIFFYRDLLERGLVAS